MQPAHTSLQDAAPQMPAVPISSPLAWTREQVTLADGLIVLSPACLEELDAVVQQLRVSPRPFQQLTPAMFSLASCIETMQQVRQKLFFQRGFAIVERVPVERYSETENKVIGWLLANLITRVVSQKWDGTMLYDVQDTGKALGYGVRRSITNLEQDFHTDGGWLTKTPTCIGLFCLQPAYDGGYSRVVSLITVHNALQRHHPQLLKRLYQPFWWDRQAEHAKDDVPYSQHPVYSYDGETLRSRCYEDYIHNGYRLANATLDETGQAALTAMRDIMNDPANWIEFRMEKGQLQYLNNEQCAHSRTAFVDDPQQRIHRHLLRIWNRAEGLAALEG